MTFYSPKQADQATMERAIRLLVGSIGKDADPRSAIRNVLNNACMNDTDAEISVHKLTMGLREILSALADEALTLNLDYGLADHELWRNPQILSHLRGGAGHSESIPSSLAALPPACVSHVIRKNQSAADSKALARMRADGNGNLAQALQAEVADTNAIASENADAASNVLVVEQAIADSKAQPLVRLGNKGYETEFGGEL